jgi:hypothetical protein
VGGNIFLIMLLCRQLRVNYIILHELVHAMRQLVWAVLCPMIGQSTEHSRTRFQLVHSKFHGLFT